ncbi:MAG: hypothetical protein RLZZ165_1974 [Bacteroidota bacterium]
MKRLHKLWCLVAWFLPWMGMGGCGSETKPDHLLPVDQMVPVLKELEIAYVGVDQTTRDPKQRIRKYEEMNRLVLQRAKIDQSQFSASYQWYESQPELLDTIFKLVVLELEREAMRM